MSTDEEVGPRLRAALAGIPRYEPGRPAAARRVDGVQAVVQREPVPAAALGARGRRPRRRDDQPLPRHGRAALVAGDRRPLRRARRARRHRHRVGRRAPAARAGGLRARATRWSTPGGRSRRTRSSIQVCGARPVPVPLTADARHDLDAMAARRHRPRPGWCSSARPTTPPARRYAGPSSRRSSTRVPRDVLVVIDEAYVEFVRDAKVARRRSRSTRPAQRRRAADVLQGVRAGRPAGRLRGRARAGRGRGARDRRARSGSSTLAQAAAIASLAAEDELLERVDALVAERDAGGRRAARPGLARCPDAQGELRLVRPRRPRRRVRAGAAGRPASSSGRSPVTACACTIGEPEANDRLIAVAARLPALRPSHGSRFFLIGGGRRPGVGRVGQWWRSVEITIATPATASAPPASSAPDATSPRSGQPRSTATTGLT